MIKVPITLKIGSRTSDLARIQAYMVGRALKAKHGDAVEVEYDFRSAPGDINQTAALWQMQEVGVFTSFLREPLQAGDIDMIVHSWKDLPLVQIPGTEIVATLPRADCRDVLLLRKDGLKNMYEKGKAIILTSSPRRQTNLDKFLRDAIPVNQDSSLGPVGAKVDKIETRDVRGNIQTRMAKLVDPERELLDLHTNEPFRAHGLILAKAALDRFLGCEEEEIQKTRGEVRKYLQQCQWMVLPLTVNPTAAAQGALGVEVSLKEDERRKQIRELVEAINDKGVFEACLREKQILHGYGGGCHQKIGCTILNRPYGQPFFLKGITDAKDGKPSEILDVKRIDNRKYFDELEVSAPQFDVELEEGDVVQVGGKGELALTVYESRDSISSAVEDMQRVQEEGNCSALLVTKADALPLDTPSAFLDQFQVVWAPGVQSWISLAKRGVWVNGCADGLGEQEEERLGLIAGVEGGLRWMKVTHAPVQFYDREEQPKRSKSEEEETLKDGSPLLSVSTYVLNPISLPQAVSAVKIGLSKAVGVYWSSGTAFDAAMRLYPSLMDSVQVHSCGPGNTLKHLLEKGVAEEKVAVCLSCKEFRALLQGKVK